MYNDMIACYNHVTILELVCHTRRARTNTVTSISIRSFTRGLEADPDADAVMGREDTGAPRMAQGATRHRYALT